VTLTATSNRKRHWVRVKRDNVTIVEYRAPTSVQLIRNARTSKHIDGLWLLCHEAGVTWGEFVDLFNIDENYNWDNLL